MKFSDITQPFARAYRRFKLWQQKPFTYVSSSRWHTCHNCGNRFQGNFCPTCGQGADVKPFTWSSVRDGLLDVWGMGSRSMPYSLWQLMWRPGYFIGDYISGKRSISFPPVKMLVVVSVFITFADFLINPESNADPVPTSTHTGIMYLLETAINWIDRHEEWATLLFMSMFILPTWFLFRNSPRHWHHNIPQGFFIQVFTSIHMLLIMFVFAVLLDMDLSDSFLVTTPMFTALLFYDYYQLFGYGLWGTLWRTFTVVLGTFIAAGNFGLLWELLDALDAGKNVAAYEYSFNLLLLPLMSFVIIAAGYIIDERLWLKNGVWSAIKWPVIIVIIGLVLFAATLIEL